MPYNFEATFTKPLIAQLDAGKFKDAQDWANAITDLYIATIKQGLPNGAPPVVPAPSLVPGPGTYSLGASGFTTADSRKKLMYNIVYAYFFAKEVTINKESIKSLIEQSSLLVKRGKNLRDRIKRTNEQVKLLRKEIKNLPNLISEVYAEIKKLLDQQIRDIEGLFDTIKNREFGSIDQNEFNQLFARELNIVNQIKRFQIGNPQTIVQLTRFLIQLVRENERTFNSPKRDELIKRNLRNRLFSLSKQALFFLEIPISPSKIVDFLRSAQAQSARFGRLVNRLRQIDVIKRFVEPQFKKLMALIKKWTKWLYTKIQYGLRVVGNWLKEKFTALVRGRKKGKEELYAEVAGEVKKEKTRIQKFAAGVARIIKGLAKIAKKCAKLGVKLALLGKFLVTEFQSLKQKLLAYKAQALTIRDRTLAVYNEITGSSFSDVLVPPSQSAGGQQLATEAQQFSQLQQGSFSQSQITAAASQANRLQQNADAFAKKKEEQQILEITKYFTSLGFRQLANEAVMIIKETSCSAKDIKTLFLRKKSTYKQVGLEILNLKNDVNDIRFEINALFATEDGQIRREIRRYNRELNRKDRQQRRAEARQLRKDQRGGRDPWVVRQFNSLKDLFYGLYCFVEPVVNRVVQWVKRAYNAAKNFVIKQVKKQLKNLENLALSLVPLKSEVRNSIDKKDILEAKKRAWQDYKKTTAYWIKKISTLRKVGQGSVELSLNLGRGDIGVASNRKAINLILDGRYEYQIYDPEGTMSVDKKQQYYDDLQRKKYDFQSFTIMETFAKLLTTIGKELLTGRAKAAKEQLFAEIEQLYGEAKPENLASYKLIKNLIDNPSEKISLNQIRQLVNGGITSFMTDKRVAQKFLDLEKRYLRKSVQLLNSIVEDQNVKERYESAQAAGGVQLEDASSVASSLDQASNNATSLDQTTALRDAIRTARAPVPLVTRKQPSTIRVMQRGSLLYEATKSLYSLRDSLNKNESFILKLIKLLIKLAGKALKWIAKTVTAFLTNEKKKAQRKLQKERDRQLKKIERDQKERANVDAAVATAMFGLAARVFWAGAQWVGPTGSTHIVGSVGSFLPRMQAKTEDGATGYVGEIARGFEAQLKTMSGIINAPAFTGAVPVPFLGYT